MLALEEVVRMQGPFSIEVSPDWRGLIQSIERRGEPGRVHHIELFLDGEVQDAICERYGVLEGLNREDSDFELEKQVRLQTFLGYDFVRCGIDVVAFPLNYIVTEDTAGLARESGRGYIDEHRGPITNWEEFERYPWPDPAGFTTRKLEWFEENLPEGMCLIGGGGFAHFAEHLTWLMGYTTFCTALYEQRDLVAAIYERLHEIYLAATERILQFSCVKALWGSDDMGYRGGPLMAPDDMREFVLAGHKAIAEKAHAAGMPYLLHSCGNLNLIMDDLIDDVKIDAKHSFEDTIERVTEVKQTYGRHIALLGGIDVDFLCRSSEEEVRARVRETLEVCMPGGGYVLGTGNSVANYIPVDNYLAMLDEGRRFGRGPGRRVSDCGSREGPEGK